MPFITVKALEGRTVEEKRAVAEKLIQVFKEEWNLTEDRIFVFFEDMKKHDFAKQGKLFIDQEG